VRVILIDNPGAGDGTEPRGAELVRLARGAGHDVRYVSCLDPDWLAALEAAADLVAVAGGDGTVGRAARALAERGVPHTALPLGTANNISRTLGIADVPIASLIAGWATGRRVSFDLGIVCGPWGRRRFVEGCGAGLFACTLPAADASRTLEALDRAEAKVAYGLQMLRERVRTCPPLRVEMALDGRDVSGDYLLVEAMNMQYVGPQLYLAPDCNLDDGLIDVVLVPVAQRDRLHRYLCNWQNGIEWPAELPTQRGHRLVMRWSGYPLHIDDRVWPDGKQHGEPPDTRIEVTTERNAVQFLVPGPVG
jgi:diacylglycerol kinase family enzyme